MISKILGLSLLLQAALAPSAFAAPSSDRYPHAKGFKNGSATITLPSTTTTVVGRDTTDDLSNKSVTDALTFTEQGSTPSTPAAGKRRIYPKSDGFYQLDSTGNERKVGSGAGGGGENYIGKDSTWTVTNTDDRDFEGTGFTWTTYADADATDLTLPGGATPASGGTPTITCARTTTSGEKLNGTGSLELTKPASNVQGQGCVLPTIYIPEGYRTSNANLTFLFKVISGSITAGDVTPYLYDSTNGEVVSGKAKVYLVGAQGIVSYEFSPKYTATAVKLALHITTTSTTAFTIAVDDFSLGPNSIVHGPAATNWTSFTPSIWSTTNVSNLNGRWRRIGDSMEVDVSWSMTGAGTAGNVTVSLPSGYSIDISKNSSGTNTGNDGGLGVFQTHGAWHDAGVGYKSLLSVYSSTTALGFFQSGTASALAGTDLANGDDVHVTFTVPISGWDANQQLGESSSFKISSYLASGTRVTSTPTKLGEYRSYYKNGAGTLTVTDVAPAAGYTPSSSNGMRVKAVAGNAAESSGNINRWDIFIGKNKNWRLETYSTTGRTGKITTNFAITGAIWIGFEPLYDPTTGILTINTVPDSTSFTSGVIGYTVSDGGALTFGGSGGDCYFDVTVSENALMVSAGSLRSEVVVHTGNGLGSTGTRVRRFTTTLKSEGTAVTYADSATAGSSFTINEDGVYSMYYADLASGTAAQLSITKNASSLSSDPSALSASEVLAFTTTPAAALWNTVTVTAILRAGDVIRPMAGTAVNSTASTVKFSITKVAH